MAVARKGTDFIDNFRSTFMGQRDQVKAERAAAKAEAKAQQATADAQKAQEEAKTGEKIIQTQQQISKFLGALRDVANEIANGIQEKKNAVKENGKVQEAVEYTYQPGDTFGQVILDLGLQTDAGLWGEDGDVAYYTQQLVDQGALNSRGNIPVGTKIVLTKRKPDTPTSAPEPEVQMNIGKPVQEAKYPPLQLIIRGGARKV